MTILGKLASQCVSALNNLGPKINRVSGAYLKLKNRKIYRVFLRFNNVTQQKLCDGITPNHILVDFVGSPLETMYCRYLWVLDHYKKII